MKHNKQGQEDLEKQQAKELKDLQSQLQSYVEVARHKLGRTPTLEEIQSMMASGSEEMSFETQEEPEMSPEEQAELDQSEPKILNMRVYHGMRDGAEEGSAKEPDERKILFYEDPDGMVYDCGKQDWLDHRPEVLDHLNSRGMLGDDQDIIAAIANGVMGDEDYQALSDANMIGEMPEKLWKKTKKLEGLLAELESVQAEPEEDLSKSNGDDEEGLSAAEDEQDLEPVIVEEDDVAQNFWDPASVSEDYDPRQAGTDHIQEMITAATATAMLGFEDRIREIVREEMGGAPEGNLPEPDENDW